MASITSPNMNLTIPTVGSQPGPTYAFDLNSSLTLIDQHDHTPGKGVQIVTAALNINANLSLNDFSLIDAISIVFTASGTASTTPNSLSVAPGGESPPQQDLWYTPNTGVPIQITKNGIVNTVASSIPGESYAAGTFFWTQEQDALPTTPANFDIGSITLRPNVALTTFGVTLSPASAISSQYSINLPLIPVLKNLVTLDTSGNMVADTNVDNSSIEISSNNLRVKALGIQASMIALNSLTTNQISLTANITQGQLAASALAWRSQTFNLSSTPAFNVLVATTANITLSGAQTIDGVAVVATNIVLVKNQSIPANNGVYNAAAGAWTRNTNYDTFGELNYAGVHVTSGTVGTGTNWFQNNVLTSLSDAQSWSKSSTVEFIVPAGVNKIFARQVGGGGGGAQGQTGNDGTNNGGGGGGGGAGSAEQITPILDVVALSSLAITVGHGGITDEAGGDSSIIGLSGAVSKVMAPGGAAGVPLTGATTYATATRDASPAFAGGNGGPNGSGGAGPRPGTAAATTTSVIGGTVIGAASGAIVSPSDNDPGAPGGGGGSSNRGPGGIGADFKPNVAGPANNGGDAPVNNKGAGGGGGSGGNEAGNKVGGLGGKAADGEITIYWLAGGA